MLWFIIFAIAIFMAYKYVIKKTKEKIERNRILGQLVRHYSVEELLIPSKYYYHIVSSRIEELKNIAVTKQATRPYFATIEYTRLLAGMIYIAYHNDCENAVKYKMFSTFNMYGISEEEVRKEASAPASTILDVYLEADRDYTFASEKEMESLFLQHLEIGERNISYNHTLANRMDKYADEHGVEWFGNYIGMRVFPNDLDPRIYSIYVMSTNPELKEKSRVILTVYSSNKETPIILV